MPEPGEELKKSGGGEEETAKLKADFETSKKVLEEMKKANSDLMDKLSSAKGLLTSQDYMDFMESRKSGVSKGLSKEEEEGDLDMLTGRQIYERVNKNLEAAVEKQGKQIELLTQQFSEKFVVMGAHMDMEITKGKHESFANSMNDEKFSERFYKLSDENRQWGAEQIFKYMRNEDAYDKQQHAESDRKKEEQEREDLLKASIETEVDGVPSSILEDKGLDGLAAAEEAFNLTMVDIPES